MPHTTMLPNPSWSGSTVLAILMPVCRFVNLIVAIGGGMTVGNSGSFDGNSAPTHLWHCCCPHVCCGSDCCSCTTVRTCCAAGSFFVTQTDVVLVQIEYRLGPLGFASFDR